MRANPEGAAPARGRSAAKRNAPACENTRGVAVACMEAPT
jgi:hypothetical protein